MLYMYAFSTNSNGFDRSERNNNDPKEDGRELADRGSAVPVRYRQGLVYCWFEKAMHEEGGKKAFSYSKRYIM